MQLLIIKYKIYKSQLTHQQPKRKQMMQRDVLLKSFIFIERDDMSNMSI